jgi:lipoprotein-anchoring transpeptidase ErfK/SrfK
LAFVTIGMTDSTHKNINRRAFLGVMAGSAAIAGCTANELADDAQLKAFPAAPAAPPPPPPVMRPILTDPSIIYSAVEDGGFSIPAVPYAKIDPKYYRQVVADPTGEAPGTLVVDTANRFLYFTMPFGEAIRYGVAIGREGFAWAGNANVNWKGRWPTWTPPKEMIERDPKLEKYSAENGGMPPGLDNPLGARALYIFQNGVDTLYRIHGSPEWKSIGKKASSGCVRLMNQDIIDLWERVRKGTPIVVFGEDTPLPVSA